MEYQMVWSVIIILGKAIASYTTSKSSMDDILTYTYTESIISEMLIMWGKYRPSYWTARLQTNS